jgi:2,4-dienoyl-CoA reductase-like NADH-dependent reductase (Old Yellow Enzyme family)
MKTLFEPHRVGSLTIKNRIGFAAMVCFFWPDESGLVTDFNVRHYQAAAAGGQGLIVSESLHVSEEGRMYPSQLGIWSDRHIAGLQRITDAVHRSGGVILAQIHHGGLWSDSDRILGPSPGMPTKMGRPNLVLTIDEIHRIQERFVDAAKRAVKAGFDGIELHGCHSYLLSDFMNKTINRRTDRYGDETLITTEIIGMIRAALPSSYTMGIRLGGFEPNLADGVSHAITMEKAGVDFIDVSYGFDRDGVHVKIPEDYPFSAPVYAAQAIKKAVNVPVFAVYGIDSPQKAANILETTDVDMVQIGRGIFVNYNWANDAREGRDTGRCVGCPTCHWRLPHTRCPGKILYERNLPEAF